MRKNGGNKSGTAEDTMERGAGAGQMVLRTVFIPSEQDQALKDVAGQLHVSKGEVIRRAIGNYLSKK
jgi:hypothetical protein